MALFPSAKKIITTSAPLHMQAGVDIFTDAVVVHIGISSDYSESTKQMEEKLNFQVPAEGLELVILQHTQY